MQCNMASVPDQRQKVQSTREGRPGPSIQDVGLVAVAYGCAALVEDSFLLCIRHCIHGAQVYKDGRVEIQEQRQLTIY